MVKVIVRDPQSDTVQLAQVKSPQAPKKRTYVAKGRIHGLDIGSATFPADLTAVFRQNVAKARRENKRVTGSVDGAPAKG